jgi:hypothetical protein
VRLALHDGSVAAGRLLEPDANGLVLADGDTTVTLPLTSVARGTVEVELTHIESQEEDA